MLFSRWCLLVLFLMLLVVCACSALLFDIVLWCRVLSVAVVCYVVLLVVCMYRVVLLMLFVVFLLFVAG